MAEQAVDSQALNAIVGSELAGRSTVIAIREGGHQGGRDSSVKTEGD